MSALWLVLRARCPRSNQPSFRAFVAPENGFLAARPTRARCAAATVHMMQQPHRFSRLLSSNFGCKVRCLSTFGFAGLPIDPKFHGKLQKQGLQQPTAVQEAAIKDAVAAPKSDFVIHSPTGTGKTYAYLLTILTQLELKPNRHVLQSLILVPTRELAVQVHGVISDLLHRANKKAERDGRRQAVVRRFVGDISAPRLESLKTDPPDIAVGTPRALKDLIPQHLSVGTLRHLVLDEVDMLFQDHIRPNTEHTLAAATRVKHRPQVMFVSASTSQQVRRAVHKYLRDPKIINIKTEAISRRLPAGLEHYVTICRSAEQKPKRLVRLIRSYSPKRVLVFCNSKASASALEATLQRYGIRHGHLLAGQSATERSSALRQLRSGKVTVLVVTEMAARGLDVPELDWVVQYECSKDSKEYLHRAGRTARAGHSGAVVSIVASAADTRSMKQHADALQFNPFVIKLLGEHTSVGPWLAADSSEDADGSPAVVAVEPSLITSIARRGEPEQEGTDDDADASDERVTMDVKDHTE